VERHGAEGVGQQSATADPNWHRARGSILGPGRLAGMAAATVAAAVARTGGRETRRGPVWPRRLADATAQRARGWGT
jgi:hypothetical protein